MRAHYKNIMLLTALYLAVLGLVFIFSPDVARNVFSIDLVDKGLTLVYGQVVLSLGYMAYLVGNNENLSKMTTGFLVLFLGQVIVFVYLYATGKQAINQIGIPLFFSTLESYLLFRIRE